METVKNKTSRLIKTDLLHNDCFSVNYLIIKVKKTLSYFLTTF